MKFLTAELYTRFGLVLVLQWKETTFQYSLH